jgi:transcriptional regulator with XRE-family HTH domain
MILALMEGQGIKRAALAADANMSEKRLERAERGQGISDDSCRRIAPALRLRQDLFIGERRQRLSGGTAHTEDQSLQGVDPLE